MITKVTKNAETGNPTWWGFPVKVVLIMFIFFLPLADEIVSYPRYSNMCQEVKKYHFGTGINAENIKGMEVSLNQKSEGYTMLFPFFRKLTNDEVNNFINKGYVRKFVVLESYNLQLINTKNNQVVVYWKNTRPESSFLV